MFVRALGIRASRAPIRDAETFPLVLTEDALGEVSRGTAAFRYGSGQQDSMLTKKKLPSQASLRVPGPASDAYEVRITS